MANEPQEKTDLLKTINREKLEYEQRYITIVPLLLFNQRDTIETIYFYYNSKYKTGQIDYDGDRKYFFNIVRNSCDVTTKAIDFDTKDVKLETADGGDPNVTWYMERDLRHWMSDNEFGKTLNRIFKELPIFGSVVLKEVNGELQFVDLRNFIVDQCADSLDDMNYKTERHDYTPGEFRRVGKKMGWNNIDAVIADFHKMKETSHIRVYERYGEVEKTDDQGNKSWEYQRLFFADVGVASTDQRTGAPIPYTGYLLRSDNWNGHPYWEFHIRKIPGRWLGVGDVELLFEPQVRQNEIANLQSKASYWAALRVFQTKDPAVNRNLFVDTENGEIINVDSDIVQIDMSDRNLAFFNEEYAKWMTNRDELTFNFGVMRGQGIAGSKSAGAVNVAAQMASAYFDLMQEEIALDVKEMIYDVVIPRFLDNNSNEHTLRIVGQDLDKLQEIEIADDLNDKIVGMIGKGKIPNADEVDLMKSIISTSIKGNKERQQLLPKGFYTDAKYKINIEITGESRDVKAWAQTMMAAIQAITVDPTILTDPTKRQFFLWWLEGNGVSTTDIKIPNQQTPDISSQLSQMAPAQGAGGGVSRPMPVQSGATVSGEKTTLF